MHRAVSSDHTLLYYLTRVFLALSYPALLSAIEGDNLIIRRWCFHGPSKRSS
jgi:hypothetical protein